MKDSQEVMATIVGAVIGGVAGFLFFTDRGRRLRRQIEPALADFSSEVTSLRNTVQEAAGVATEGWKLLTETLGEGGKPPSKYPGRQTSPF